MTPAQNAELKEQRRLKTQLRRERLRSDPVAWEAYLAQCRVADARKYEKRMARLRADPEAYRAQRDKENAREQKRLAITPRKPPARTPEGDERRRASQAKYLASHREERNAVLRERRRLEKLSMTPEEHEAERVKSAAYHAVYRANNAEKRKALRREYLPRQRELMKTEPRRAWMKAYGIRNKAKLRAQMKARHAQRLKDDIEYRIATRCRARIRAVMSRKDRSESSLELMGCTLQELRAHLESKFLPGMSLENYGVNGWVIDHVIPISAFLLTDEAQRKRAFHFTNLQPLWAIDNLRKHAKLPPGIPHPNPPCVPAADGLTVPT